MSGACRVQKRRKVPLVLKVWLYVPFFLLPDLNFPFASETLCLRLPFHVHTTFTPLLIVIFFGPKRSSLTAPCLGFGLVAPCDGSAATPAAATTAMAGRTSFLI